MLHSHKTVAVCTFQPKQLDNPMMLKAQIIIITCQTPTASVDSHSLCIRKISSENLSQQTRPLQTVQVTTGFDHSPDSRLTQPSPFVSSLLLTPGFRLRATRRSHAVEDLAAVVWSVVDKTTAVRSGGLARSGVGRFCTAMSRSAARARSGWTAGVAASTTTGLGKRRAWRTGV